METITFNVTEMSCMGCVNSVRNLLSALPGVGKVEIDLASGRVSIEADTTQSTPEKLKHAVEDGGYGIG